MLLNANKCKMKFNPQLRYPSLEEKGLEDDAKYNSCSRLGSSRIRLDGGIKGSEGRSVALRAVVRMDAYIVVVEETDRSDCESIAYGRL